MSKLLTAIEEQKLRKRHYDLCKLYQAGDKSTKTEFQKLKYILEFNEKQQTDNSSTDGFEKINNDLTKLFSKIDQLHQKVKNNNEDLEKKLGERKKKIEEKYTNPTIKTHKVDKDMER